MEEKVASFIIPLTKVDEEKRLIIGRAIHEVPDKTGEIIDYATAVPAFKQWSDYYDKATGGLSKGNLRVMHGKQVAGKITDLKFDDDAKAIDIVAKVVDDNEWKKVLEGVYTGFSVGGSYLKKWDDEKGLKRYTPKVTEMSLVDSPCIPTAKFFELHKADGSIFEVDFKGGEEPLRKDSDAPAAEVPAAPKSFGDLFKAAPTFGAIFDEGPTFAKLMKWAKGADADGDGKTNESGGGKALHRLRGADANGWFEERWSTDPDRDEEDMRAGRAKWHADRGVKSPHPWHIMERATRSEDVSRRGRDGAWMGAVPGAVGGALLLYPRPVGAAIGAGAGAYLGYRSAKNRANAEWDRGERVRENVALMEALLRSSRSDSSMARAEAIGSLAKWQQGDGRIAAAMTGLGAAGAMIGGSRPARGAAIGAMRGMRRIGQYERGGRIVSGGMPAFHQKLRGARMGARAGATAGLAAVRFNPGGGSTFGRGLAGAAAGFAAARGLSYLNSRNRT